MLQQVARVVLFRTADSSILLGAHWDVAGLFVPDESGMYTTICPPALQALEKAFCREERDRILADLVHSFKPARSKAYRRSKQTAMVLPWSLRLQVNFVGQVA